MQLEAEELSQRKFAPHVDTFEYLVTENALVEAHMHGCEVDEVYSHICQVAPA